jgi:hypothetical protein
MDTFPGWLIFISKNRIGSCEDALCFSLLGEFLNFESVERGPNFRRIIQNRPVADPDERYQLFFTEPKELPIAKEGKRSPKLLSRD